MQKKRHILKIEHVIKPKKLLCKKKNHILKIELVIKQKR